MMHESLAAREDLAALKGAVQVLAAIIDGYTPDSTDVEELRRFAPLLADLTIDELACNVVDAELKRRRVMRTVDTKSFNVQELLNTPAQLAK